jgi:hypothetical protein
MLLQFVKLLVLMAMLRTDRLLLMPDAMNLLVLSIQD